jgi:hypothetical protein
MHQSEAVAQYEPVVAGASLVEEGLFFDEDEGEDEDESEAAREEEHDEEQRIAMVKKEGEQYCSLFHDDVALRALKNELNAVVVLQVQGDSQEDREDLPPRAVPHDRRHPVGRPCQPTRPSPPGTVPQRLFFFLA